jgi:hypothetical protein
MPLTVTREGAAPVILSVQTVLDQLHRQTDVFDLLARVKRREQVPVRFRDGSTGTVGGLEALVDPSTTGQTALALVPIEPRVFQVKCKLLLEVPLSVELEARHRGHAEAIVKEVFQGVRPRPSDFDVDVDREEMVASVTAVDDALAAGNFAALRNLRIWLERTNEIIQGIAA